jgi:CelD/BcsL family acetyltransferase involved in cellulose biosynthesis
MNGVAAKVPEAAKHANLANLCVTRYEELGTVGATDWNELWGRSELPTVFARYEWMHAWWQCFGAGRQLVLYAAHANGRLAGLFPMFRPKQPGIGGAPGLVGEEHADYAGILTDPAYPGVLAALLDLACLDMRRRPGLFVRDVRDDSSYADLLTQTSSRPFSRWRLAWSVPCPRSSLDPQRMHELLRKQSLKRHGRQLAMQGDIESVHLTDSEHILPRLDVFFDQHVARWQNTAWPSLFTRQANRDFYRRLARDFSGTGLLVYSEIRVSGEAVACHFGFVSESDFIWYKPSFSPPWAKLSPGETLLRELLLYARGRGLTGFDFTRGDEAFKRRFSDSERQALTFQYHPSRAGAAMTRARELLRRSLGR